jgi:hypothetical protein
MPRIESLSQKNLFVSMFGQKTQIAIVFSELQRPLMPLIPNVTQHILGARVVKRNIDVHWRLCCKADVPFVT